MVGGCEFKYLNAGGSGVSKSEKDEVRRQGFCSMKGQGSVWIKAVLRNT